MKQYSSSEVNTRLTGQDVLFHLWNTKVHYPVHKSSPVVTIVFHMNPGDTLISNFIVIHFELSSHLHAALHSEPSLLLSN
jgi:hypothetical protein